MTSYTVQEEVSGGPKVWNKGVGHRKGKVKHRTKRGILSFLSQKSCSSWDNFGRWSQRWMVGKCNSLFQKRRSSNCMLNAVIHLIWASRNTTEFLLPEVSLDTMCVKCLYTATTKTWHEPAFSLVSSSFSTSCRFAEEKNISYPMCVTRSRQKDREVFVRSLNPETSKRHVSHVIVWQLRSAHGCNFFTSASKANSARKRCLVWSRGVGIGVRLKAPWLTLPLRFWCFLFVPLCLLKGKHPKMTNYFAGGWTKCFEAV